MNHSNKSGRSDPHMLSVKAAAKRYFYGIEGVEGIGIGDQRLRVYVRTADLAATLPEEFQGVPIDYIVTGEIRLFRGNE